MQSQNPLNYGSLQVPPLPMSCNSRKQIQFQKLEQKLYCIKCGSSEDISAYTFDKKYVSPVASLGIFIGILPYFVLRMLLATTHRITSPFCEDCWSKYKNIEIHSALFNFGTAMFIIVGFLVGGIFDSFFALAIGFCIAVPLFIYGRIYVAKVSPKFKKITDKQVIIKSPIVGEIVYIR